MQKEVKERKNLRRIVAVSLLTALLAVSAVNAVTVIFQKTVQITVGEPITLSNNNWLPASQTVNPGQNVNYTVYISNNGLNPHNVALQLNIASNGPKGTVKLFLNGSGVVNAYFNGNVTSKTYTISPFNPGTTYHVRLNVDIPGDSPSGQVNMTVVVNRVG